MALRPCQCDYCRYPLLVSAVWRWPLERDSFRRPPFRAFPRAALVCQLTPGNLFGFVQIRSGCVNPEGGYVDWHWHRRDFERFLAPYGLEAAYRDGGMLAVLRRIGLTRMQTEALELVVGRERTQAQAAFMLGITQGAVSLRLSGAMERIQHYWQKQNLIVRVLPQPISERTKRFQNIAS
jgi:predicted DNA-binding protein (UPF0251 family)